MGKSTFHALTHSKSLVTEAMLFSVPQLISVVSKVHTLEEGDLLLTGTPAGVGPVAAGDSIEVGIEELATTASFSIIQEAASTRHAPCCWQSLPGSASSIHEPARPPIDIGAAPAATRNALNVLHSKVYWTLYLSATH